MKIRITVFFTLAISSLSIAQTFKGTLHDALTKEPIPYVNIGVVGKGHGTVSTMEGQFSIVLPDSMDAYELRFSCIGYKSLSVSVKEFRKSYKERPADLLLDQNIVSLNQVTVKPKEYKTSLLGNTNNYRGISAGFMSNDLGSELGTIMKVKHAPCFIENVNFNIASNLLDSVKFRINIYSMKDGKPDSILLKHPIYITTDKKYGTLTVDLRAYNLQVDSDFFVSLEWIEDYGKHKLYFCAGLTGNNSLYRKTSQDVWSKVSMVGIGFSAKVTYEK